MIAKLTLYCACVALAAAAAAPAPATTPLQDMEKHAAEFTKLISEQFNAIANSKNTEEVKKSLKEGTDSVLQQLSALSTSLQGAMADANGKAKEALETTRANIEKTSKELRAAHPEVEQQATALQQRLQEALKQGLQHSQQLAKEVQASADKAGADLQPKIKQAYDDFVKQAEDVQRKLHEAATRQ